MDEKVMALHIAARFLMEMREVAKTLRAAGLNPTNAASVLLKGTLTAISAVTIVGHKRKLYAVNRSDEEVTKESFCRILGLTNKPKDPEEHSFAESIGEDFSKLILDRVMSLPPA